jgi:glyoxylase-like metal-dependent hydrolase (beta-lactamase superfamily II)
MAGEGAKIESVWSVKYGERVVRKSDVFYDYTQYGLPDGDLDMDYNFWVIKSGDTVILMDTGYDIAAHDWLGEISVTPTPEGLKLIELDPLDVDIVITSHFHYDHIGYLYLFENAQVISGQAEYDYWFAKRDSNALEGEFTTADNLVPVEKALQEGRLRLISDTAEVFPGITVYQVGGHCPGELIALIETASGSLILASDAAHFYEQLENEWPFFAFTNLDQMRAALSFILKLSKETGATVIPGHDGRTRQKFPPAPGMAGTVATVLA